MNKKFLAGLISALMCVSLIAGCGANTANTETADETAAEETVEPTDDAVQASHSDQKSKKISVKDLSETSTPIGVADLEAEIDGNAVYVSGRFINNEAEYEKTVIEAEIEVLNSAGETIASSTISTFWMLDDGDEYPFDEEYVGKIEDGDVADNDTLTVEITEMTIKDSTLDYLSNCLDSDKYDLDDLLDDESYNQAQILWEEIQEEYGDDLPKELKKIEAELKDGGFDPTDLSKGPSDGDEAEPEAEEE
ncbi:MAG: hypothetical protein LUF26_06355 [Firmicutes bacterium]|nr:hypothetical protein [Bacillota bacterium]